MSDTCDPAIYFPNNVRRVEIRILIPLGDHPEPWHLARAVMANIEDNSPLLFGTIPWWAAADVIDPDQPLIRSPLHLVEQGDQT